MEQTLQGSAGGGDRVLVNRIGRVLGETPEVGDIVVFTRPAAWKAETGPLKPRDGLDSMVRTFGDLTGIGPTTEEYLAKRIVARQGQTISCCNPSGHLERDGESVEEPYVYQDFPFTAGTFDCNSTPRSARCFDPFRVPEGQLVLLGDHRSASADSAVSCRAPATPLQSCMRTVPVSAVVGRVFARIWPLDRIGGP